MSTDNPLMQSINDMHTKFGIKYNGPPRHIEYAEKAFRIAALQEELNEYAEADSLVEQYDSLLDLIVFAVGTLERHGMPLQEGYDIVMACNMAKEVGNNPQKGSNGRGNYKGVDLVKPAGWTGPEDKLTQVLVSATTTKENI
jgi:predicted HAD superfamily Cof-like phosphohydrolase